MSQKEGATLLRREAVVDFGSGSSCLIPRFAPRVVVLVTGRQGQIQEGTVEGEQGGKESPREDQEEGEGESLGARNRAA